MGLSLSTLDWTIGCAALAANVLFGLWLALRARKSAGSDEFFLAGRRLTWPIVGASLLATNIGAEHMVGLCGDAYRYGLCVPLNQERLESTLIHVPRPHRMPPGVPALRMRQRKPANESRKVALLPGPEHHMPMVRHRAVRQQTHPHSPHGLVKDPLEGIVIFRFLKDRHSRVGPIQHVIYHPAGSRPQRSSHATILPKCPSSVKNGS